jgi:hypothetical protein
MVARSANILAAASNFAYYAVAGAERLSFNIHLLHHSDE